MKLGDTAIKALTAPASGNKVYYDDDLKGFGLRVTHAGARAFVLNYRTRDGRERRLTIGPFPDWKTAAARAEASGLKMRIGRGDDPMAQKRTAGSTKTIADLCERFAEEHLPRVKPGTAGNYKGMIDRHILPELSHRGIAEVTSSDIAGLHRKITESGRAYAANRLGALLSKMFGLAMSWQWRPDNPCKGLARNPEEKRRRYLSPEEMARLTEALAAHGDEQAANVIRLLLLTGARRGEVLAARWADMDMEAGIWTKQGATTKQRTLHRVPLSAPARLLLAGIRAAGMADTKKNGAEISPWVFPGRGENGHRAGIKKDWAALAKTAKLTGARIHDLRHTFASLLLSSGEGLPVVGALLGHSNGATAHRYSHLLADPLREAANRVGALIVGGTAPNIAPARAKKARR